MKQIQVAILVCFTICLIGLYQSDSRKKAKNKNAYIQLGQELSMQVINGEFQTISNGSIVVVYGFSNGLPIVKLANPNDIWKSPPIGCVIGDMNADGKGKILIRGVIDNIDTSGYKEGQYLYLGTNGTLSTNSYSRQE